MQQSQPGSEGGQMSCIPVATMGSLVMVVLALIGKQRFGIN